MHLLLLLLFLYFRWDFVEFLLKLNMVLLYNNSLCRTSEIVLCSPISNPPITTIAYSSNDMYIPYLGQPLLRRCLLQGLGVVGVQGVWVSEVGMPEAALHFLQLPLFRL